MISSYIILIIFLIVFITSIIKKNNTYTSFIKGVKEGFKTSLKIAPSMFVMYIAINLFAQSKFIENIFKSSKISVDLISQGLFRPLSSSASLSFMIKIFSKYGADSKLGYISSILQGSVDSSIYIISYYLGTCNIKGSYKCILICLLVYIIIFIICLIIYLLL